MPPNRITHAIGNLNAHHPYIDGKIENNIGKTLKLFINNDKLIHLGPNFPTFYSYNISSNPDLILSNNKTYHNIQIISGPITPPDHIAIIIKITVQRVITHEPPSPNLNKADWEAFRTEVERRTENINTNPIMSSGK